MTTRQTGSEEEWYRAYEVVYRALPDDPHPHVPCPNCGHDALRVAFTGPRGGRVGFVSFWCDNCLHGVHYSRATAPDGVDVIPIDLSEEEHARYVPNYTFVLEDEDDDVQG